MKKYFTFQCYFTSRLWDLTLINLSFRTIGAILIDEYWINFTILGLSFSFGYFPDSKKQQEKFNKRHNLKRKKELKRILSRPLPESLLEQKRRAWALEYFDPKNDLQ